MEERLARNFPALTEREQERLGASRVCIVGCGGLGGYIAEYLTRIGVGKLTLIDGDSFEPSNLNRQLLATNATLGRSKAMSAAKRVLSIAPGTELIAHDVFLDEKNAPALIRGADLVMDALDSPHARRILAAACREAGLPLVHGAIRGWNAQIAVCLPGSAALETLYPENCPLGDKSCLSFTPALCAAIQCAEAVKLLVGRESALMGKLLLADLRYMEFETIPLE